MDLPTIEQEKKEYINDLHTLAKAQRYVSTLFGDEAGVDYMITEVKKYCTEGKFSDHCYEYALKELPVLTEAEMADILPKTWDGKPIFSHKDVV
jgi:hypothetical protein